MYIKFKALVMLVMNASQMIWMHLSVNVICACILTLVYRPFQARAVPSIQRMLALPPQPPSAAL